MAFFYKSLKWALVIRFFQRFSHGIIWFSSVCQWWPNYGPRSFIIWPAKIFYTTAIICVSIIFYIHSRKKKNQKIKNYSIHSSYLKQCIKYFLVSYCLLSFTLLIGYMEMAHMIEQVRDLVSLYRSVFVVTTSFNNHYCTIITNFFVQA